MCSCRKISVCVASAQTIWLSEWASDKGVNNRNKFIYECKSFCVSMTCGANAGRAMVYVRLIVRVCGVCVDREQNKMFRHLCTKLCLSSCVLHRPTARPTARNMTMPRLTRTLTHTDRQTEKDECSHTIRASRQATRDTTQNCNYYQPNVRFIRTVIGLWQLWSARVCMCHSLFFYLFILFALARSLPLSLSLSRILLLVRIFRVRTFDVCVARIYALAKT